MKNRVFYSAVVSAVFCMAIPAMAGNFVSDDMFLRTDLFKLNERYLQFGMAIVENSMVSTFHIFKGTGRGNSAGETVTRIKLGGPGIPIAMGFKTRLFRHTAETPIDVIGVIEGGFEDGMQFFSQIGVITGTRLGEWETLSKVETVKDISVYMAMCTTIMPDFLQFHMFRTQLEYPLKDELILVLNGNGIALWQRLGIIYDMGQNRQLKGYVSFFGGFVFSAAYNIKFETFKQMFQKSED